VHCTLLKVVKQKNGDRSITAAGHLFGVQGFLIAVNIHAGCILQATL